MKVLPVPLPGSHHRGEIRLDVLEIHSPEDTFYTLRSQSTVNTEQPDDKEFPPKFTRQLYFTELHSSTIIKFNLFTELCVARLTGNEGRKLLLGLGWAEIRFDKLLLGLAGTREYILVI